MRDNINFEDYKVGAPGFPPGLILDKKDNVSQKALCALLPGFLNGAVPTPPLLPLEASQKVRFLSFTFLLTHYKSPFFA